MLQQCVRCSFVHLQRVAWDIVGMVSASLMKTNFTDLTVHPLEHVLLTNHTDGQGEECFAGLEKIGMQKLEKIKTTQIEHQRITKSATRYHLQRHFSSAFSSISLNVPRYCREIDS